MSATVPRATKNIILDLTLLIVLGAALAAALHPVPEVRPYLVLLAALLVPGGALVTLIRTDELLTEIALAVGLSVGTVIMSSLVLAWTGWWNPDELGIVLAGVASTLLIVDLVQSSLRLPPSTESLEDEFEADEGSEAVLWLSSPLAVAAPAVAVGAAGQTVPVAPEAASRSRSPSIPINRGVARHGRGAGRRGRAPLYAAAALLPAGLAVAVWALTLNDISLSALGKDGLAPKLTIYWYGAFAVLLAGAAALSWARWAGGWIVAAYLLGLVAVIYATVPAITEMPEHSYVYKHIGVTEFIATNGGIDWGVDIYNRWPGFFAGAASLAKWTGVGPVTLAKWAGPVFAAINALLVASLALSMGRDRRVAAYAAVIFTICNWVGQNYFAPQAGAFILELTLLTVFIRLFAGEPLRRMWARLLRPVAGRLSMTKPLATPLPWPLPVGALLVVLLDVAIVATHQLTPYALLLQLCALFVLGVTRPMGTGLIAAFFVITAGYLIPQVGYLRENFGLLQSFDPVGNATNGEDQLAGLSFFQANAAFLLTAVMAAAMLLAALMLLRRGAGRRSVVLVAMSAAPMLIVFVQGYGNNVPIRLLLFALPAWSILVAMGLGVFRRARVRTMMAIAFPLAIAPLFVQALYGALAINVIPRSEVEASRYFYEHAPAGSVLLAAAPEFPGRVSPRYSKMIGPIVDDQLRGTVLGSRRFRNRFLRNADVSGVVGKLKQYSQKGFVVFATTGYRFARLTGLSTSLELRKLELAVLRSPKFELWYSNPTTRIYRWIPMTDRRAERQAGR